MQWNRSHWKEFSSVWKIKDNWWVQWMMETADWWMRAVTEFKGSIFNLRRWDVLPVTLKESADDDCFHKVMPTIPIGEPSLQGQELMDSDSATEASRHFFSKCIQFHERAPWNVIFIKIILYSQCWRKSTPESWEAFSASYLHKPVL